MDEFFLGFFGQYLFETLLTLFHNVSCLQISTNVWRVTPVLEGHVTTFQEVSDVTVWTLVQN